MPLRTTGSIMFPYQIELREADDLYRLDFGFVKGLPSATTTLIVDRSDLRKAFDDTYGDGENR